MGKIGGKKWSGAKRDIPHLTARLRKLAGNWIGAKVEGGGGFVIDTARARYKIPRFRYAGLGWVYFGLVWGLGLWCAIGISYDSKGQGKTPRIDI